MKCGFSNAGLEYLHLLNEKFQAKIADFDLSRVIPTDGSSYVIATVAGTPGYLDPE